MLPSVSEPSGWRVKSVLEATADHLIEHMSLDVALSDVHDDLIGALRESRSVRLEWADRVEGTCELHGTYDPRTATIRLELGSTPARTNFTAAHELGHHLQYTDREWGLGVLAQLRRDSPTIARFVEEDLADVTAARLLIPADHVQNVWTGRLTPGLVDRLRRDGRVSHHAAIIRAASLGAADRAVIIVADQDGRVIASRSTQDDLFQAPRGVVQPDLRELFEAGSAQTGQLATAGIVYSTGNSRTDLVYDSSPDGSGNYVIVVARPVYQFGTAQWQVEEAECSSASCSEVFAVTADTTCPTCSTPKCPNCGTCEGCEATRGRVCDGCWIEMSLEESRLGSRHQDC